ncbi:hypothetical protein [Rhodoligotrophos ferricapiens]|uniref:hypothetical protein n=1 Tax=Rhodoligotrophos ferricapiens TaxID=3069264 RepID=UPI00315D42E1
MAIAQASDLVAVAGPHIRKRQDGDHLEGVGDWAKVHFARRRKFNDFSDLERSIHE